ncbi:transcription factor AIG1 [Zea mays]|uniref:Putative HLH DNA-binding domain superfamily protein n=1 Tax=Zea mays TaxID=4577 RepID=A0A1D6Q1G9_MAIZE|nr:transcription factor AIG1 [Zea mays]AQK52460.1 Putative HLH DNA-binding domain superfamily protein [Zea mays]|eukprot:XP_008678584.1 transcription factor AIG1 [Zea mays]
MWEGGGFHGSHEALLLQAAGSGAADYGHGAGPALLPWLGPAAGAAPGFSYMAPHHAQPGPSGAEAAASPFGFGGGGYSDGGVGGQFGVFGGPETALPAPHGLAAAAGGGTSAMQHGSRMVSGLLGTLQMELGRMAAKEIMDAKALAASRSHSEAERRRRQRINSHLARLRSLLPNTSKTDKASLLAEVIEHVKELKRQTSAVLDVEGEEAAAARQRLQLLPTEADDLAVDATEDGEGRLVVRASLCCEDRAGLIPDIARALAALRLRAHRAEIATLGGRVRNVLLITAAADDDDGEGEGDDDDDDVEGDGGCAGGNASSSRRHELVASIQEALRGVMDCKTASSDTSSSSNGGGSMKRQRMSGAHEQGSL